MGLGVGIVLVAIGAILAFAVGNVNTAGTVDLHSVGYILLIVGVIAVVLSMVFWSSWGGSGVSGRRRTTTIDEG
ncbi:MAG TPA: DUF6458 family protein [Candidatus Dormibacteraeota bacterium]|jgi:hypothetical protein